MGRDACCCCCCCWPDKGAGDAKALDDGGGEAVNVLAGGEMMPEALGAGEMELNPTRSLRLAPCEPETGLGAAIWAVELLFKVAGLGGRESPGIEGLVADWLLGVADWKSSKSSSSAAPPACKEPNPSSIGFGVAFLPFEAKSLGGVFGGISSASKLRMSISGSFFFGGSGFLVSRRADDDDSGFRRAEVAVLPSSYSSYSSNLSRRLVESWNSDVFPPKPPPSP